jgi:hypothetical protein
MKLTTKELMQKHTDLSGLVVKFTEEIDRDTYGPNKGMIAKIVSARLSQDDVVKFTFDFSNFVDYNKPLAERNWFDKNGIACETWFDQDFYARDDMPEMRSVCRSISIWIILRILRL